MQITKSSARKGKARRQYLPYSFWHHSLCNNNDTKQTTVYLDYAIIMHENLASVKSQSTLLHFFSIHKMLYFTRDISLNTGPNLKAKLEEHSGNFVDYCFFGDDGNGTFLSSGQKTWASMSVSGQSTCGTLSYLRSSMRLTWLQLKQNTTGNV